MASTKRASQAPLDKMQTEVGNVLNQLGKIFMHAHQGDSVALGHAKAKAATGIPDAARNFDEAWRQLERDLGKASKVIQRQLDQLREKRAAREKAAGAARLQANAANGTAVNGQNIKKDPGSAEAPKANSSAAGPVANGSAEPNLANASNPVPNEFEDLFGNAEGDVGDTFGNGANQQSGDAQSSLDDLFGDNEMNFEEDFGMSTDGGGEGFNNLIAGLQKYVNRGPENGNTNSSNDVDASNGQTATNATDDVDLDSLLEGFVPSTSNDASSLQETASAAVKPDQTGLGEVKMSDNGPPASNGANQNGKSEEVPAENAIDPNMMEMTFDFDDFPGTSYEGGMSGEIDDLFNFD